VLLQPVRAAFGSHFRVNTAAKVQSLAAAKATLNGLTLNCAVYTILQNTSWAPENVTFGARQRGSQSPSAACADLARRCGAGDGFAHLVGFSSNRLVPLLRAGNPDDPTVTGGPAGGWGFSVPTKPGDIDGASVWMLKWCAAPGL
jgi:hypothetical protein